MRTVLRRSTGIAEKRFDPNQDFQREDWNRAVDINQFVGDFEDWRFDWIDVPALIRGAEVVYEYPMVDRDPLAQLEPKATPP